MATTDLPAPSHAHNMRLIGHTDQDGRGDGQQTRCAMATPISAMSLARLQRRRRARPDATEDGELHREPAKHLSLHLQVHDDLLLLVHGRDMFSQPEMADERNYYKPKAGAKTTTRRRRRATGRPAWRSSTSRAGRAPSDRLHAGRGHRAAPASGTSAAWWTAPGHDGGLFDYILVTIDMADPTKPAIVGRYWLPGMNLAAGEEANWPLPAGRYGLHHAVVQDDVAYCAWRDACLVVVDVKDRSDPKLVVHKTGRRRSAAARTTACRRPTATSSCSTRRCLTRSRTASPIWVFDNQVKSNPSAWRLSPSRTTATISRSAATSARTTSMKIGRGRSSARS